MGGGESDSLALSVTARKNAAIVAAMLWTTPLSGIRRELRWVLACAWMGSSAALLGCGADQGSQRGPSQAGMWSTPVSTSQTAFQMAAAGDWGRFYGEVALPCAAIVELAAGQPLPWGMAPEQLCAVNRTELRRGFERVRSQAAGPLVIRSVDAESLRGAPPGVQAFEVNGSYRTRMGSEESVRFKLVWRQGRFFVTGM